MLAMMLTLKAWPCVQALPALPPLAPEGAALRLHPGGPGSGRLRGAGGLPAAHLGHPAGGAGVSAGVQRPAGSLRPRHPPGQVLEGPQEHLHHHHPHAHPGGHDGVWRPAGVQLECRPLVPSPPAAAAGQRDRGTTGKSRPVSATPYLSPGAAFGDPRCLRGPAVPSGTRGALGDPRCLRGPAVPSGTRGAFRVCVLQLRRAFRSIRNAVPQIFYVFLLFMFSLLIFSLMALKLLGKRGLTTISGAPYFTSYLDIVFDLYVLVTTANSPDVMMPAYNASFVFAIFFILYILINTYIFMSVFLAVVYNNYKKYLKEEVRQLVRAKRHKMVRAFAVLQEQRPGAEPVVTRASWTRLVGRVRPGISTAHRELLWSVSDDKNRGCIGKLAFVQLADLLNIEVITLKSRPHPLLTRCPALYLSAPSRLVCRLVQHRAFVVAYDLIILVNAVFIGLDEDHALIAHSEWAFLALYLLEILLKLYVVEPRAFFSRHCFWNWFDTIIVISALVATVVNSASKSLGGYSSRQILDIVFILRVLRLVRVVDSIQRFRTIINTLIRIGPAILTFGQLIIVVYYIFAMVGMELFKGRVRFYEDSDAPEAASCGNALLEGTAFAQLGYCKNNFNNVVASFVLLLELTVVNQWHVLSSGFAAVTHVSARIFFVLFHIVVVIVIINIFVAFVLEAFLLEYSLEKSDLQTSLERKIQELELGVAQEKVENNLVDAMETSDGDQGSSQSDDSKPGLRFKIASKRYRTVDALLQRMFESDLDPEDFAESDDPDATPSRNFSNPVFSCA
ncbi:two pore segment channel 3 isoform X1 [Antennarius striatus]|uniref:two pore segment channel 3 isoform X1 n=1 Tax=Antennarius striatus TaxID=241820 RepID=UPI0035B3B0BA